MVIYSDNSATRGYVAAAVGTRPDETLGEIEYVEVATHAALLMTLESSEVDAVILDAESQPTGGLGVARQLKDELSQCPPLLLLLARDADSWLATWSGVDDTLGPAYHPTELTDSVIRLLRGRD